MEEARQEFNQALSVLLQSKYGILSDNQLSEEFNVLTDNINGIELAAIHQGTPLSPHQYAPTPEEAFSGLTFASNAGELQRVRQEMLSVHPDIPFVANPSVAGAIAYLTAHARGYLTSVLEGLGRYGPMISEIFKQEGLPHDLVYLPGPESLFDPSALSRKGAKGLWQLMPDTARESGLRINRWVDERSDPYKSTVVAARDLKYLYHQFGDWYLALAAYDSGPVTVQRAIASTGYADYWTLRRLHVLLPETENYVPLFLATMAIAKDPKAYGFNVDPEAPLEIDRVNVRVPTDLRLVAGLLDYPPEKLKRLNPDLRGWVTPEDDPAFTLNLPKGTAAAFEQRVAVVPASDRRWWRAYRVSAGDTLGSVALHYHVSEARLVEVNQLSHADPLSPGSYLMIPLAPWTPRRVLAGPAPTGWSRRAFHYRVRRGDTLDRLAERYHVSVYELRRWNGLRSSRLIAGRTLLIYRFMRSDPRRRITPKRKLARRN